MRVKDAELRLGEKASASRMLREEAQRTETETEVQLQTHRKVSKQKADGTPRSHLHSLALRLALQTLTRILVLRCGVLWCAEVRVAEARAIASQHALQERGDIAVHTADEHDTGHDSGAQGVPKPCIIA